MDPNYRKPSTPSRPAKQESEYLEGDDCRTAVETESLTDASIPRVRSPVSQQTPRDAWANVAPSSQPRIVPATRQSQADREAQEIATSTQRALETLRNSSDPRNRLFVSPAASSQTTPKCSSSPFRPFSGQGRAISSGGGGPSRSPAAGVRTAVDASPVQSSIRTAAARSPDVRTGVENSGRSARLREAAQNSRSSSAVRTARSITVTPKKNRNRRDSGCTTVHTAAANYEIDLRQRTNSMTGPTSNVATARTISPVASSRTARSPARPAVSPNRALPYYNPNYPPLPSEGDPTEQPVEIFDRNRLSQEYTPHVSRPILFGTGVSGVRTARAHSPARTRTLSERTALGDTSLKTSRSPASKSEKSVRTGRSADRKPPTDVDSHNSNHSKKEAKILSKLSSTRSSKSKTKKKRGKSQSQSTLASTSARSYASGKTWATDKSKTPCRKSIRSAHKSASETPAGMRSVDASSKSGSSRRSGRSNRRKKTGSKKAKTPLRTAAALSARSPVNETAVSPDILSTKRSPVHASPPEDLVRPMTPDTPRGWPYRASEQMRQTPVRIAPSSTGVKTAKADASSRKSSKSPAQRSQKELHREAKSASSASRRSQRATSTTSNVSTANSIVSRVPGKPSSIAPSTALSPAHSSKSNARTFSASTLRSAKRKPVSATDNDSDFVIETVQAHGNIQIDLCFNFRVRAAPGQGFGESRSPIKPKEVLINGQSIWRKE